MGMAALRLRPAYLAYRFFWSGLDWLFPPDCVGCGKRGYRWCPDCQGSACTLPSSVCPVCGEPGNSSHPCNRCRQNRPAFQALRSCGEYGGSLREALHQLKYRRNIPLGESLSRAMINKLDTLEWRIELVVPVPLGQARLKERGYNQAALLAFPIALAIGVGYSTTAVWRARETRSQVDLNLNERMKNVAGAFAAARKEVSGKRVLIIDDVATTGSTISACADALIQTGASAVFGLTLARAVSRSKQDIIDPLSI